MNFPCAWLIIGLRVRKIVARRSFIPPRLNLGLKEVVKVEGKDDERILKRLVIVNYFANVDVRCDRSVNFVRR